MKTHLSNHVIVATTSHLEKVLIRCTRCTGIYRIYVCKRIVSLALTCRIWWKNLCSAHLLPDLTVTWNHWRIGMFVRITDSSFLLKFVSRVRGKTGRLEQNKGEKWWLSGLFFYNLFFWLFYYPYSFGIKNFFPWFFFSGLLDVILKTKLKERKETVSLILWSFSRN